MEAYFSIRNGNAMVFPLDLETGAELQNKEVTPNGFKVDLANSHYLQLTIKKEVLNSAGTGILEDTRFNKVISDNSVFDQEGKYTISVTNLYTGLKTEKIIYVGNNPIMKCHMITGLTIEQINVFLNQGYTIGEDGKLIAPPPPPPTTGNSSTQPPNYTPDNNSNSSTNYPYQNSSGCSLTFSPNSAVFILLVLLTTVACTTFNRRERKK
jgi:hypothetical protein